MIAFAALLTSVLSGCHEPCKEGYGRASDSLCYPLADRPCGEGYGRTDDGECTPIGGSTTPETEADADADSDADSDLDVDADTDADADADADGGGTSDPPTGFDGRIDIASGIELDPGLSFVINAWTTDQVDPETGWPSGGEAFQSHEFSVVAGGITLNYTFPLNDVPEAGIDLRVTVDPVGTEPPWDRALPTVLPVAPDEAYGFQPGDWRSNIDFTIQLSESDDEEPGDSAEDSGGP